VPHERDGSLDPGGWPHLPPFEGAPPHPPLRPGTARWPSRSRPDRQQQRHPHVHHPRRHRTCRLGGGARAA
jgi:hypothetical protein